MASTILNIDTLNSKVSFNVKKLGFLTIKGVFEDLSGEIVFDKNDLNNSFFHVCANVASINTGNDKRDKHLKSEDFFSIKERSKICFESTSITQNEDVFLAKGTLKLLNTIKEISIPFEYNENIFTGNFSLNRLDYQLGNKFPSFIVGKIVQISISCKTYK